MVTLNFKLSSVGKVDMKLTESVTWLQLLDTCASEYAVQKSGVIAVRNGKVLSADDLVAVGDVIDVFPAISGG
jgi:sulfur carrier protein ThiS